MSVATEARVAARNARADLAALKTQVTSLAATVTTNTTKVLAAITALGRLVDGGKAKR